MGLSYSCPSGWAQSLTPLPCRGPGTELVSQMVLNEETI